MKACVVCGQMFAPKVSHHVACGPVCSRELHRRRTAARRRRDGMPPPARKCVACKRLFLPATGWQRYCGRGDCQTGRRRMNRRRQRAALTVEERRAEDAALYARHRDKKLAAAKGHYAANRDRILERRRFLRRMRRLERQEEGP